LWKKLLDEISCHAVGMPQLELHPDVSGPRGERVLVRRSARRRRSVSITRREGDLVLANPATVSLRPARASARRIVDPLARKAQRTAPTRRSDASLAAIARELSDTYLGGRARPTSVSWSTRQQRRWGSCTPAKAPSACPRGCRACRTGCCARW